MQASSINVDSNLWKSRPRNNIIDVNIEINRENVWKIVLSQTTMLKFVKLLCNYPKKCRFLIGKNVTSVVILRPRILAKTCIGKMFKNVLKNYNATIIMEAFLERVDVNCLY